MNLISIGNYIKLKFDLSQLIINLFQQTWLEQQDTNLLIVIAIAISTFVTLAVTLFFNWFLQSKSYKEEYYKKIIDKRIQNYEMAENLLRKMRLWHTFEGKEYHSFFDSWQAFGIFYKEIIKIVEVGFWLDKAILTEFLELNGLFYSITITCNTNQTDSKKIGISYFDELCRYSKAIEKSLYEDFKKLHKIRAFIRSRKNARGKKSV